MPAVTAEAIMSTKLYSPKWLSQKLQIFYISIRIVKLIKLYYFLPIFKSDSFSHLCALLRFTLTSILLISGCLFSLILQFVCYSEGWNDVLVFVCWYWSVLYLGRYVSLFRMAALQAGTQSLFFIPCLFSFASLASLTALLYWINSSCHFPC